MTPEIALVDVSKRFGETGAVEGVSLALHAGEFVALLGPSGCGKSTTLRMLAGLEQPSAGRILMRGRDVTEATAAARNVALMFQSYALYPHLTVRQNIAAPLRIRGLSPLGRLPGAALASGRVRRVSKEIDGKVRRIAERLRIGALLDRRPGQLSGGQQQRVALARALVREPTAFLLDEPLSNLDTQLRAEARAEIKALHRSEGRPFLLVTHDQSDALSMADRVAVMIEGRIVQLGAPDEIFAAPATIAVAAFIGHHRMNILPRGAAAALHPAGGALDLGVRPQDLAPDPSGPLEAVVETLDFHGEETTVRLRHASGLALLAVLPGGAARPAEGETLRLSADVGKLHGFDARGRRAEVAA